MLVPAAPAFSQHLLFGLLLTGAAFRPYSVNHSLSASQSQCVAPFCFSRCCFVVLAVPGRSFSGRSRSSGVSHRLSSTFAHNESEIHRQDLESVDNYDTCNLMPSVFASISSRASRSSLCANAWWWRCQISWALDNASTYKPPKHYNVSKFHLFHPSL